MRSYTFSVFVMCFILISSHSTVLGTTWRIKPDGSGDAPTIQAGIILASAGDTVLVEQGTYCEYGISLGSGICLRSETGEADCAIIDAQHIDRVMRCYSVNSQTAVEGFTLTNGIAEDGGGLYCVDESSPTFSNCLFIDNSASWDGGGVYCSDWSYLTLIDCTIKGNSAYNGGSGILCRQYSSIKLIGCTLTQNDHHGLWCHSSSAEISDCTFSDNLAYVGGGASFRNTTGTVSINSCAFADNTGEWRGGGVSLYNCTATVTDCDFSGNITEGQGGGVYCIEADVTLAGCSFINNSSNRGGALFLEEAWPVPSRVFAEYIHFQGNTAAYMGIDGFVGDGSEAHLRCTNTDIDRWVTEGEGSVILDNEGCETGITDGEVPKDGPLSVTTYPNPFNPITRIAYTTIRDGYVSLGVYDAVGCLVKSLVNGNKISGEHTTTWEGRDNSGAEVSAGVYFIRLEAGRQVRTRKIVLLK